MALRTIRMLGDPVLNKVCREVKEVTPKISTLISDMLETMYDANGVGLAAPQVGVLKRVVTIDVGDGPLIMINPQILASDGTQTAGEGCLSLPGKAGQVTRPNHVVARAYNEQMQEFEIDATELLARAICHESDHLEGHMYTEFVEGDIYEVKEDGVIYLAGKKGLHRHVMGGAAMEQIIDGKLSCLGNPQYGVVGMLLLNTGEFLALSDRGKLINFTYDPNKEAVPQERLKIYSLE